MRHRQSNTYTTRVDGKLIRHAKPLSKGAALIQARGIVGPNARLYSLGDMFYVSIFSDNRRYSANGVTQVEVTIAEGKSWEQALKAAGETEDAKDWHDAQIAQGNVIAAAKASFKKAFVRFWTRVSETPNLFSREELQKARRV